MFKKLLLAIIVSFSTTMSSMTNHSVLKDDEITKFQDVTRKEKQDQSEKKSLDDGYFKPVTGDYEIIESARSSDATKDQYEDNNSIGSAKIISPLYNGQSAPNDYSVTIYGTLHRNEWLWGLIKREVDEDYYQFEIYGKSQTIIELSNIPDGCDYDLELYKHDNKRYAGDEQVTLVDHSTFGSNINERIDESLFPGVYYIRINSYNNVFNAQSEYKLSLSVDYTYENVSISELRYSKGVGAALWVSDYDPFEIQAFTSQSKSEVGFYCVDSLIYAYKFGNPLFRYIKEDYEIKHASLYIWDLNLRRELYDIIKIAIDKLSTEFANKESLRLDLDVASQIVNGVSTIVGLTLLFVPVANMSETIKITLDITGIVSTISPSLLDCVFDAIMPESLIEQKYDYLNYLKVLATALECNSSTSNQEVIKIDSNYKIVEESMPLIVQVNYDIDFTPSIQSSYLYDSDTIYAFQKDAKFNGTIYPLKTLDDIKKARNKNQITYDDVNTGGDTELLLGRPIADEISIGEYKWYHFKAPDNGIYKFKTSSNTDTYGELFTQIVPGTSTSGILIDDDDGGEDLNFELTYEIFKGRTIYLRVRGYNWRKSGLYSVFVEKIKDSNIVDEYINGANFGFQNEYVDDLNRKAIVLDSGFSFTTQRMRCGYINGQYLALSAKCRNAGLAYLQMDFTQDIQSFDFEIAIWSNQEYLNQNSSIKLKIKGRDGAYKTKLTFNIAEMSKDKDDLDNYSLSFDEETFGIRIEVTTNQVNYEKNKGRVVLSNFIIRHSL